jgi:hypothetical protein
MLDTVCLHHQGDGLLTALMMEAASISEKSVNFYQTTLRYNPKDSHLNICFLAEARIPDLKNANQDC